MADSSASPRIHVNEQISLTALRVDDVDALVTHLNDEEIYRHTLRIPFPYTPDHAHSFLAITQEAQKQHGHPIHLAIRDQDDQLIGGCGYEGLRYGHRAEIGYWLARSFWGRGIMSDVVGKLREFACQKWKLVRLTAHVFSFNARSARVLEKNGFQCEGLLRKQHQKDGKFIDSKLFAYVSDA